MTDLGQENEVTFTDAQQAFIDKKIGQARIKAREKAETDAQTAAHAAKEEASLAGMEAEKKWKELADHHSARVLELEPLETQVKVYEELVAGMLKDRIKVLGDAAKKFVASLPETMTDVEKLNLLNKNEALFGETTPVVGTPARKKKSQTVIDKGREAHRRRKL